MNIEARKISFIQEFLRIKNEDIIIGLENMLKQWQAKYNVDEVSPMSIKQFNEEIEKAMKDIEENNVVSAKDLLKKWQ
jgi:hypothetical protein